MAKSATLNRDQETTRTIAGVRLNPTHWASTTVHAHRQWTGETTMTLWCGIEADFSAGARQTIDLISCVQCAQSSWVAWRGM